MPEELARDHLPIADRPYAGKVYVDAKDPEARFPPIEPLRPPAGAPNVRVILLDASASGRRAPSEAPARRRRLSGSRRTD
jgi:hypothetical protein